MCQSISDYTVCMVTAIAKGISRNPRQEAQHQATRRRLLLAGRNVLAVKGYAATVVADILQEARVSRASFYAHFDSMAALVLAIADDFAPVWQPVYAQIATLLDGDIDGLTRWCERMVAVYREHEALCVILAQASMIDQQIYWKIAGYQEMLIDLIADGDARLGHLRCDAAGRLRAALALTQLDQACYFLAVRRWGDDPRAGIDAMAAQLRFFLVSEMKRAPAGADQRQKPMLSK